MASKRKNGRQRVQYVTVRVTFNRAITRQQAAKEFGNSIHGEHYCGSYSDAESFHIRGVKPAKL